MPAETPTKPVSCPIEFILKTFHTDFDLLLVVGGFQYPDSLTDVELVTLDPDNFPVPPCLTNLKELPFASFGMAGAVDEDGNPFICGGARYDQPEDEIYDQCYRYDLQADSWEQHGTMPYKRVFMADTVVPGLGLVMVGGSDGSVATDEVIATTDGVSFKELAPLPEPSVYGRCNSETRTQL